MSTTPSSLAAVSSGVAAAREHVRLGRLYEAEQAFRGVLEQNPDQVEALRFLANAALARGNPAEAVLLLSHAAESDRNDPDLLLELGAAYRASDRLDAARYVLERAVDLGTHRLPVARLLLANVLELDQRHDLALLHYFRAILEAQGAGQWRSDATTEPGLRRLVRHAMDFAARERRALFDRALQELRETTSPEQLQRVDRALSIYLLEADEHPVDPLQKPTFLYVPGVEAYRFIDDPGFDWLERCARDIAASTEEVIAIAKADDGASPAQLFSLTTLQGGDEAPQPRQQEAPREIPIYQRGLLLEPAKSKAPHLVATLAATPLVHIPRHGPDAEIVLLPPDSRLPLRHGRTNSRLVAIVALGGSATMDIAVGGETRSLDADGTLIFDSTFGYEYASRHAGPVKAVAFEIWHPALTAVERKALETIATTAVEFDGSLQELS